MNKRFYIMAVLIVSATGIAVTDGAVVLSSRNKTANISSTVYLVCVSYGDPASNIRWTSTGLPTITNSTNRLPAEMPSPWEQGGGSKYTVYERNTLNSFLESVLKIESVEMKDDGEYTCTASCESSSTWATEVIRLTVLDVDDEAPRAETRNVPVEIGGATTAVGIILSLLSIVLFVRYRSICRQRKRKQVNSLPKRDIVDQLVLRNRSYADQRERIEKMINRVDEYIPDLLVCKQDLELIDTIGEGEFSVVHKARLQRPQVPHHNRTLTGQVSYEENSVLLTVAVKALKGDFSDEERKSFMKESLLMYKFDHPNVITLLGLCLDAGPSPYIVLPFMENGSLLSYVRKNKAKLLVSSEAEEEAVCTVRKQLTDMCLQIAKGMEYLMTMKLIHRDLAARNCMIDESWVIKVADFGLSEMISSCKNYFRQSQGTEIKLPVKWLAPECLREMVFSEKSDVWAYGVTCWEIFSAGSVPYPGIHSMGISKLLNEGVRLQKPENTACGDKMYTLIKHCWEKDPELRPRFSELVKNTEDVLEDLTEYLNISTFEFQEN